MVILLPLLRRLQPTTRLILGVVTFVVGLAAVAVDPKALLIPGAISVVVGIVALAHGVHGRRHQVAVGARR